MSDICIIKTCYFCDHPKYVNANYEEKIDEHDNYHEYYINKYKNLWICRTCSDYLQHVNFSIQENGECCICLEEKILLTLPCIHKICIQCCKTIYYGSTTKKVPVSTLTRPDWPYEFYCPDEEELRGTRKSWMIWDEKEANYGDFLNEYLNEYLFKTKSYDELVALRDSLILAKVEERLDWMNTEEFITYENLFFCYKIETKKMDKKWKKFNKSKTKGNGLCPLCRAEP